MQPMIRTALMPKWWQSFVLILLRLAQILFLVPFYLYFSERASLTESVAWFLAVVAFQYVLLFIIRRIEDIATRSKIERLLEQEANETIIEGDEQ
ncbi:hypothetical protein [uncultured Celeribacter sp.]|uniref:hypothetical protein n=1 Tax=uncultured Celeribacter sp. TaxID=1303376 RepID=UPI002AA6974D|nr:hypothetical protein [uncultured Celeribacter sp.]